MNDYFEPLAKSGYKRSIRIEKHNINIYLDYLNASKEVKKIIHQFIGRIIENAKSRGYCHAKYLEWKKAQNEN